MLSTLREVNAQRKGGVCLQERDVRLDIPLPPPRQRGLRPFRDAGDTKETRITSSRLFVGIIIDPESYLSDRWTFVSHRLR